MLAGALLFLALFVGFILVYPTLRRTLRNAEETSVNVEKASRNAAEAWKNLAEVSHTAREAVVDLARLARTSADGAPDIVAKVQEITENVKVASTRVADASKLLGHIRAPQDAAGQSWVVLGEFFKKLLGR